MHRFFSKPETLLRLPRGPLGATTWVGTPRKSYSGYTAMRLHSNTREAVSGTARLCTNCPWRWHSISPACDRI